MRIRVLAALLVLTSSILLAPAAGARPCLDELGLIDYPLIPLVELADVILVLKPDADYGMISNVERVVHGDIQRIDKGVAPQTIVFTANSFGAGLKAGAPVKLFLKPFSDRNVHYVIAISPPEIPPQVSISVSATDGDAPVRVTPIGSSIAIEALVTAQNGLADLVKVDVYAGFMRPNGDTVWVTGNALAPTLTASAGPVPFPVGAPAKATAFGATYRFASTDPPGWYLLNGLVVRTGTDPHDPCQWIHTSTFPFLVTPAERAQ